MDTPRPEPRTRAVAWLRREALPLLVMLLLLGTARASFANHYQVPSGSMQPTLQPGDRVVVDMSAYGLRVPFTRTYWWNATRRSAATSPCSTRPPTACA